jgi:hypothetical protein
MPLIGEEDRTIAEPATRTRVAAPPEPAPAEPAPPVPAPEPERRKSLLPFGRRETLPARAFVEPEGIHFGELRKGDERSAKVRVRIDGGQGRVGGQVLAAPAWVSVSPAAFTRRRQWVTLTAHSERTWQTGVHEDVVRLETTGGEVQIPVALHVLKPRPSFSEVAIWFVPLFLAVLLPALTVAFGAQYTAAQYLVPAAALGSGLLAAMLLLVALEADLGFAEKSAAGVLLAVMTMVLGITIGLMGRSGSVEGFAALPATGVPIGVVLLAQIFSRRHWKVWAAAVVVLSALTSGTFAAALSGKF